MNTPSPQQIRARPVASSAAGDRPGPMLARPRIARLGSAATVLATSGLLGLAAGLPIRPVVEAVDRQVPLPTTCTGDFACTRRFLFTQPIVVGALLVAGALFGLVAQRLTRAGSLV